MDVLSANIATFLTQFVPFFFLPHVLRNFGVKQLLHPSILSIVLPSSVLQNIFSFERLYGIPPNYSNLKVFGCACFVLLHPHEHTKLEPRVRLCCFLGYGTEYKGFRCSDPLSNRLRISRHVTFCEHTMFSRLSSFHASFSSPQSFFIDTFIDLFPLSESTPDNDPLAASGSAHLVAKGYSKEYGIDYEETFAPVARMTSVRSLLAVAAAKQWSLLQMDVKNAFLNGTLFEEVYMKPPPGTSSPPHKVCLLRRALYGLKQAPRAWFATFSSTITQLGFTSSLHDTALFTRHTPQGIVLLLLYVDDMIITGNDPQAISDLQHYLGQHFEMKDLGSLNYFLGLEVFRCSDGYLLSQAKYASDLLARSGITNFNTASTPLDLNVHLTPYDGVPLEDVSLYWQLVGSLIYLTVTRPDIAYVVHIVSQFMAAP
ncbi:hypothetical protein IC582_021640 [Cucumis melo]